MEHCYSAPLPLKALGCGESSIDALPPNASLGIETAEEGEKREKSGGIIEGER